MEFPFLLKGNIKTTLNLHFIKLCDYHNSIIFQPDLVPILLLPSSYQVRT